MVGPERIGRYPVSRQLGSGGFATVWLAFDDVLNARVAIKVLAENWSHMPDIRERFLQEAKLLRKADSDRVVRVYDIGELPDGRPYFVMSYADRGTVAERLGDGPLPVPQALHIAIETARAVAVLHRMDVIHRDIKPSNVLIQSTPAGERILISDLGVAKSLAFASGFTNACGTPGYMAPEQAVPGFGLDVRADIYGLGALTYHLITGRKYNDGSALDEEPRTDLPKPLARTVLRALKHDRNRRYPDAVSFASALTKLLPMSKPSTAPAPTRRVMSRRRAHAVLVALLLAASLVIWGNGDHGGGRSDVANPTTSPSAGPSSPALAATNLEFNFAIDPMPGFRIDSMSFYGKEQTAEIVWNDGRSRISVYEPHTFDPDASEYIDEQVTVAGRVGFYVQRSIDAGRVVVEYAPSAWYEVSGSYPNREVLLRIAAAVKVGIRQPLRFPIQVGYLPVGLRVCGGIERFDLGARRWSAGFQFCDGPTTSKHRDALRVDVYLDRTDAPRSFRLINGMPVLIENIYARVDYGEFMIEIESRGDHRYAISGEFEKMIRAIAIRGFEDRSKWFAGAEALPAGS